MKEAAVRTKRYITCPRCNEGSYGVEHLLEDTLKSGTKRCFGPWQCSECNAQWIGEAYPDGSISIEMLEDVGPKTLALLKLRDLYVVTGYQGLRIDPRDKRLLLPL